jgi:L-amino acid N-acyltransferase YncA
MKEIAIKPMTADSWADVVTIYESGIASKNATFEINAPNWETWDNAHRQDCRLIASIDDKIVGWAALSNVSSRCVYSGVAEVSIYVDSDYRGIGVGDSLMSELISKSEISGIWTLQAGIFPENTACLRLHEKHGFRLIGKKERIGKMDDTWRDVFQLERRSKIVGNN